MLDLLYKIEVGENDLALETVPREEFPYVVRMQFRKRYWTNEIGYDSEYSRGYYGVAAWLYRNIGEGQYKGVMGRGRNHWFALKTKQQAMLVKLSLS